MATRYSPGTIHHVITACHLALACQATPNAPHRFEAKSLNLFTSVFLVAGSIVESCSRRSSCFAVQAFDYRMS